MKTNSAAARPFHENPSNYQQFQLRELRTILSGRAIISLDSTSHCQPYDSRKKAK